MKRETVMLKMRNQKCVKCKHTTKSGEEFHLIFDENGQELELQKLLKQCFSIEVYKKRRDNQGLCGDCVEFLVDTYDLIQKNVEKPLGEETVAYEKQTKPNPTNARITNKVHNVDVEYEMEKIFNETNADDPLEIEQVYVNSKHDLGKYFFHDDKTDEESTTLQEDDIEEFKGEVLETNEDSIDIYQYKKSIIKIDPMDINFKTTIFCVVSSTISSK